MFRALASSPFISGRTGSRRPRWAQHRRLGFLPSCPAARVRLDCNERQKVHGGLNGSGCSWGVSWGSESKPEGFRASQENPTQLWPRVPHVTCGGRVFSAGKQASTCPGQLQTPCISGTGPLGAGECPGMGGTPGCTRSAPAWREPLGSQGLAQCGRNPWGCRVQPGVGGTPGDMGSAPGAGESPVAVSSGEPTGTPSRFLSESEPHARCPAETSPSG